MSMTINGAPPPPPLEGSPGTKPVGGPGDPAFDKVFNQVAGNIMQGGQSMLQEAMQKFFEEEEPDEDDPDAEPL